MLRWYWFKTEKGPGFGVTAFSVEDAEGLLYAARFDIGEPKVVEVVENVDIRDLDQRQVVANMGSPYRRGIWFPLIR
jgi:hypothetical protein